MAGFIDSLKQFTSDPNKLVTAYFDDVTGNSVIYQTILNKYYNSHLSNIPSVTWIRSYNILAN